MFLSKKLARIRKKPERVRQRYVIFTIAIVALGLIIVWVFTSDLMLFSRGSFIGRVADDFTRSFQHFEQNNTFKLP